METGQCTPQEKKQARSVSGVRNLSDFEKKKPYPDRYPFNDDAVGIEFVSEIVDNQYVPLTQEQQELAVYLLDMLRNQLTLGDDDIYVHPEISYKEPANEACCVNRK